MKQTHTNRCYIIEKTYATHHVIEQPTHTHTHTDAQAQLATQKRNTYSIIENTHLPTDVCVYVGIIRLVYSFTMSPLAVS